MNWKFTSNDAAAFNGDGIEHTLVTTGLIAAAVRIEIDVCHRLRNAEAAADKRIAVRMNGCHEHGVSRIQSNQWRGVAEVRFRRIKALPEKMQRDKCYRKCNVVTVATTIFAARIWKGARATNEFDESSAE